MPQQDTYLGRIADLRQRFRREPENRSWLVAPRRALRFLALAVRKARSDNLTQQSAALAFITLVSLVPLLSALSFLGARSFERQEDVQEWWLSFLGVFLPFSEEALLEQLGSFVDNASAISGFGFLIFIITAIMAFSSIDQSINRIWNVPHQRPFRVRLLSFTLLLFWGPVVIGSTYSSLFFLERFELVERFARSASVLIFIVTLVGLTMLYWLVPYTKVHFRSALGGSFVTTLLLEVLRQGFGFYFDHVKAVWMNIYSGLGLAFFFVISVQISWWLVLLGSEVAFCIQHHAVMIRERRSAAATEGSWLGLVALVVLMDRFRAGDPMTPHQLLADRLNLHVPELLDVLKPLLSGGLVRETGGDEEGFLLSCDPYQLKVASVFELYERDHWVVLESMVADTVGPLEKLRVQLTDARDGHTGEMTLADLLAVEDEASSGAESED